MKVDLEPSRLIGPSAYEGLAGPPPELKTLVDIIQWRASVQGDDLAFTYLVDGENEEVHLSYRELDRRATSIAAKLQMLGAAGKRILLVIHPGTDYIVALFGCFYAGAVAVPVYPPDPFRGPQTLPRLRDIAGNAQSDLVLSSEDILHWAREPLRRDYGMSTLAVQSIPDVAPGSQRQDTVTADQLALLQYTSGTTGTPKGVMLTHDALMHNLRAMHRLDTPDALGVCWLPPYHDMGLVGGLLLPIFSGRRNVIMSPAAFIQRPARWLHAISRYSATISGSPDFGFELCVRKVGTMDCQGLDLRTWKVAITGAEPVRAETLDRFTAKFAPYGFHRETFYPAYGLAEATVMVTGGRIENPPVVQWISEVLLARHRAEKTDPSDPLATALIGTGQPVPQSEVTIVDPKTRLRLSAGNVGEIWVRGPSVGAGYWQQPEATQRTFHARIADTNEGPYLRTGDLGFVHDGELFVTGRWKELIILRGRNYYPRDIEQVVRGSHAALRNSGTAFSIRVDGEEQLVIVQEARRRNGDNTEEILQSIRRELAAHYELTPYCVSLVAGGTLPKTSSGKLRRRAVRERFLHCELPIFAEWCVAENRLSEPSARGTIIPPQTAVEQTLAEIFAEILGVSHVGRNSDFFVLGGRSIHTVQVMSRVSEDFGVDLPLRDFFQQPTVAGLASLIEKCRFPQSELPAWVTDRGSPVVPIRREGKRPPFFTVHPAGGYLFLYYRLAEYLGIDQPVYGLQARGLEAGEQPHTSVEEMAADYVTAIREVQPEGPYALGGWSFGGLVAFEMARQLVRQGQSVGTLVVIDPPPVSRGTSVTEPELVAMLNEFLPDPYRLLLHDLRHMPTAERLRSFVEQVEIQRLVPPSIEPPQSRRMYEVFAAIAQAVLDYRPEPYPGMVHVLCASQQRAAFGDQPSQQGWRSLALDGALFDTVPGDHLTMFHEPNIQVLAEKLGMCLANNAHQVSSPERAHINHD